MCPADSIRYILRQHVFDTSCINADTLRYTRYCSTESARPSIPEREDAHQSIIRSKKNVRIQTVSHHADARPVNVTRDSTVSSVSPLRELYVVSFDASVFPRVSVFLPSVASASPLLSCLLDFRSGRAPAHFPWVRSSLLWPRLCSMRTRACEIVHPPTRQFIPCVPSRSEVTRGASHHSQ